VAQDLSSVASIHSHLAERLQAFYAMCHRNDNELRPEAPRSSPPDVYPSLLALLLVAVLLIETADWMQPPA
jgi:hypothetical protein